MCKQNGGIKFKLEALKKRRKSGQKSEDIIDIINDNVLTSPSPNTCTNDVIYTIIDPTHDIKGCVDLTGRFPRKFFRGNEYVMIGFHDDANSILTEPLKIVKTKVSQIHANYSTINMWQKGWYLISMSCTTRFQYHCLLS